MAGTGAAVLDFGAAPGSSSASVAVTGQGSILSTSHVEAWLMAEATASHNAIEHLIVPMQVRCGDVVAGTGFTIHAATELRLTGTFAVRWVWAD